MTERRYAHGCGLHPREMDDEALWHIVESQWPPVQMQRWRRCLAKHEMGDTLTPDTARALEMLLERNATPLSLALSTFTTITSVLAALWRT